MDEYDIDKKYDSFKIPGRRQFQEDRAAKELSQTKIKESVSFDESPFYEIEYDTCPMPGVGRFVLKSQKIEEPKKDEKRDLFGQMREIARTQGSAYDHTRFFDRRVQLDNARIFYKQGIFMKDFTDDYSEIAQFSQYFPYYQMMGYEQLRTYFTWRTEVRKGKVADISLSYVFLYIYELLSNIGVKDPQEGLDQLMSFWRAFAVYNKSIDRYVLRWLKDYHIYYELSHSFKEFLEANKLEEYYPKMTDTEDNFDLFCSISKYDIRKSTYFTEDKVELVKNCFYFVIHKLRQRFGDSGINFEEEIFQATKKMTEWKPFRDALFYPWRKQADRRIVLSENEIYICSGNKWAFSKVITSESGRQLIGYIIKQMEVALRKATNYKFKLTANINTVAHEALTKLKEADLSLEIMVNSAVEEFYKEETKTVVIVDKAALLRIKQEALLTQEKLIVPEQQKEIIPVIPAPKQLSLFDIVREDKPSIPPSDTEPVHIDSPWESLKKHLSDVEIKALSVVLQGETELKKYADECGIMLEVLADGINEKAIDFIGDNLLDDEFALYDDYKEQVKELVG
ncbi:TerB N-terminal domain-containing protein [Anaerocolumna sp. AGMB13020]|uniref:TerB N-terminal domain-containing protein n=1 Tax=Anaerocolumna sp. AGMB13020 TaxID=3081750 RepID=UPI002954B277|nr:TerB N-terminal domain-containing protein [Anaerocolumna sp. AGMB13020]WOO36022.1 TerB N-terminal domain-containing protein [Anaerocolumna sp. AGMB13020]